MSAPYSQWITCFQPRPASHLNFLCLPHAGGGASIFHTWSTAFTEEVAFYAVELPGHGKRLMEPPFRSIESLIPVLANALLPILEKPCVFFGHSLGALICYELAHHIRRFQLQPAILSVSGRGAPQLPKQIKLVHQLPDKEFIQELKNLNGLPQAFLQHEELLQMALPVLRADIEMSETYTYIEREPLTCPISAFGGLGDTRVSQYALEAWQEQTEGLFRLRLLEGDHFFIHSAQGLLLQALSEDLTQSLNSKCALREYRQTPIDG